MVTRARFERAIGQFAQPRIVASSTPVVHLSELVGSVGQLSSESTSEPVRQVCVRHFRRFAVSRVDWMPGFPASGREGMLTNAGSIG